MRVLGRERLEEFRTRHADARAPIDAWLAEADAAAWQSPTDIKARYRSASFLSDNRVVFNLKGNKYRLETKLNFEHQIVLITRIGTHAEYSKWVT
jgi:mRNA interferase HigB